MKRRGRVYLVGAGPGDPGLLTVRGRELLGRADVVFHDALVNPRLLQLAREDTEIVYVGKRSSDHAIPQAELNKLLVAHARAGKMVVRLKGGDPFIFGRGGEEAMELARSGIPFEIVPGVSSISSVPCYGGIPITHRDHCSSLLVVSGHHDPEGGSNVDWRHVAQSPGTVVILMGVQWIRSIVEQLTGHGMDPETPTAMIRCGTTSEQSSLAGTLETIADQAEAADFKAPAVTVIGSVVNLRESLAWFQNRPLFGQRIVVTRARHQSADFVGRLRELGAQVLEIPTIRMDAPKNREGLRDALMGLNAYEWIIFTSPNGVARFFEYFFKGFEDLRDFGGARIAAVGPGTAAKLKELHLKVDVMPDEALGVQVAKALAAYQDIENVSMLLLRAEEANPDLPEALEAKGAIVDDVACYRTVPEIDDPTGDAADFQETGADWITFTSGSTVKFFHERFNLGRQLKARPGLKFLTIGPETTRVLEGLGCRATIEAPVHTTEGMIEALLKRLSG